MSVNPAPHLGPGTMIGRYRISGLLGAGGMGEVYQARDTTLDREVAIKILPAAFAADTERVARFRREAKTLASLNHPNIGGIHGLEEHNGVLALAMELVEGEDLSVRIARGAIPLDDALPIAKQIAEALEAAHEQGIVHRDLKPANIKVRGDGTVKVLDFGLAKAIEAAGGAGKVGKEGLTQSPTITTPAMTAAGIVLGTAAYMSPEQAKGRPVDKRSDVWAFGAVLYEMLSGRRAFKGDDVADTMAAVLRQEIDWTALPATTPASVRRLLARCLERDVKLRLRDIGEARIVLADPAATVTRADAGVVVDNSSGPTWRRAATMTFGALVLGSMAAAALVWFMTRPVPPSVVRTTIRTSGTTALAVSGVDRDLVITPDGSRVVYRGNNQLLVRKLDQLEPAVLVSVGSPQGPFISPDGQQVGFFDGPLLKKVAITGGSAVTIANVGQGPRGATWGTDGTIVFATATAATGLQRVSEQGGDVTVLTTPERERGTADHVWPEFLPGGKGVLFTARPGAVGDMQVAVLDLKSGTSKVLFPGSQAHYVSTGHLVYGIDGTLRAAPFDLERFDVIGAPVPVLESLVISGIGAADASMSVNGSLAYVSGVSGNVSQTVSIVDRQGRATVVPNLPAGRFTAVRVSPDGARLALAYQGDVWTYEIGRGSLSKLTTHPAADHSPLWTPDGKRIVFTSRRNGPPQLFWRSADGSGSDEMILERESRLLDLQGNAWAPDGKLIFSEISTGMEVGGKIGEFAIGRSADVRMLVSTNFNSQRASVSPDGWLAYQSNETGQPEIYVERYPAMGSRQKISTGGGRTPLWAQNGASLVFASLDSRQMMVVSMRPVAGRPQVLFPLTMAPPAGGSHTYDMARDEWFAVIRDEPAAAGSVPDEIVLVQNWFEELRRLVPVH